MNKNTNMVNSQNRSGKYAYLVPPPVWNKTHGRDQNELFHHKQRNDVTIK